ncbi:hypothetical protein DAI22_03g297101 [Oryza sativa Japonica Group]|nr:hypothetical protein DAI22_03g297101 [Oryza sativa Japonica Group]
MRFSFLTLCVPEDGKHQEKDTQNDQGDGWDINQLSENQRELTSRLCRMSEASSRARSTR